MRVTIINTGTKDSIELPICPALDGNAHIVYDDAKDGTNFIKWNVDKITCYDLNTPDNNNGIFFELNEPIGDTWEVVCTDNRITFWTPYSKGLFGKTPKEKAGKCSAGHLYYNQIGGIRTGYIAPDKPFFSVGCRRTDGTMSNIMIFSKDKEKLKVIANGVHTKLTTYLKNNGLMGDSSQKSGNSVSWDEFLDSIFVDSKHDISTVVPTTNLKAVANSLFSK